MNRSNQPKKNKLLLLIETPQFQNKLLLVSAVVLVLATVFMAYRSALIQQNNADQLIDTYLFQNLSVFHGAVFPAVHTFVLKWPLFALMALLGGSKFIFIIATVLLVVITISALAFVLWKIEKRPHILSLLFLALASIILLIPAQPYDTILLPVNLAMTTTRNIEYALFLAVLYLMAASKGKINKYFIAAIALGGLLVADDKLFFVLYLGGSLLALGVYLLHRNKARIKFTLKWVLNAVLAFGVGTGILVFLNALKITHITDEATTSPFPLVHSVKQVGKAVLFAIDAVFNNFGANPIHRSYTIFSLPSEIRQEVLNIRFIPYLLNILLLLASMWAIYRILKANASQHRQNARWLNKDFIFFYMLLAATVASYLAFILTDHYYPVDDRYVTINLFLAFVGSALYLKAIKFKPLPATIISLTILLIIPFTFLISQNNYRRNDAILAPRAHLNQQISSILKQNNINIVIGDYWQVTPLKDFDHQLTILPINTCLDRHGILTSDAWFNELQHTKNKKIAFLASKDPGIDRYNGCNITTITTNYGFPDERIKLSNVDASQQELFIYSHGINSPFSTEKPLPTEQTTVLPGTDNAQLSLAQSCPNGASLNVVAHQDDDLLFMSPDIIHAVQASPHQCLRTVYLTAGQARDITSTYWHSRETGDKAAYAEMAGVKNNWLESTVQVNSKKITIDRLVDRPDISLMFFRLPDGNVQGNGFPAYHGDSLKKLLSGAIPVMRTVDGSMTFSKDELISALATIMEAYNPNLIRTQNYYDPPSDGDHSDHHAAALITRAADEKLSQWINLYGYRGYSIKFAPVNVFGADVKLTQDAFFTYAKYDSAVCSSIEKCKNSVYGMYLLRQYQVPPITKKSP